MKNGKFNVSTNPHVVAKNANRTVGIYPETKKPQWFSNQLLLDHGIIFSMEETAVEVLKKHGNWLRSYPVGFEHTTTSNSKFA